MFLFGKAGLNLPVLGKKQSCNIIFNGFSSNQYIQVWIKILYIHFEDYTCFIFLLGEPCHHQLCEGEAG